METTKEQSAIEKLIFSYSDAFNAKDLLKTVALYEQDGILMPNNSPLAQGTEQLTASFEFLFKNAQINIQYIIDEVMISGEYAFARTNSKVETIIGGADKILLDNKELFVLRNQNDEWKISRYIFNNTKTTR